MMNTKCLTLRFGSEWSYESKINSWGLTNRYYRKRVPTSWPLGITKCTGGWNYHITVL